MVEKLITFACDVVDIARYQAGRKATSKAPAVPTRACRHCGAALLDGESEDECSSSFNTDAVVLRGRHRKTRLD